MDSAKHKYIKKIFNKGAMIEKLRADVNVPIAKDAVKHSISQKKNN